MFVEATLSNESRLQIQTGRGGRTGAEIGCNNVRSERVFLNRHKSFNVKQLPDEGSKYTLNITSF